MATQNKGRGIRTTGSFLGLFACVACGPLAEAERTAAQTSEAMVLSPSEFPTHPDLTLGDGYDSVGGQIREQCVEGVASKPEGSIVRHLSSMHGLQAQEAIRTLLGMNTGAAREGGPARAGLMAQLNDALQEGELAAAFAHVATVKQPRTTFERVVVNERGNEAGWNGAWNETCGDEFVLEEVRGALFCTVLRLEYTSREARQEVEGQLQIGTVPDLAKVSAQLRKLDAALLKKLSVSVHVVQLGGDARKWSQASGAPAPNGRRPSSAGESRLCVGANGLAACNQLLQTALRYAGDPSWFAGTDTIDPTRETATLAYITKRYDEVVRIPFVHHYTPKPGEYALLLEVQAEPEYVIGGPIIIAVTLQPSNPECSFPKLPEFSLLSYSTAIGVTVRRISDGKVILDVPPNDIDPDGVCGETFFELSQHGTTPCQERRMLVDVSSRFRTSTKASLPGDYTLALTYNLGHKKTTSQPIALHLRVPTEQEKKLLEELRSLAKTFSGWPQKFQGWPHWTDTLQTEPLRANMFPQSVEGWQRLQHDPFRFSRLLKYLFAGPKKPEHVIPILNVFESDPMFAPEIAALKAEIYLLNGAKYELAFKSAAEDVRNMFPDLAWQLTDWDKNRGSKVSAHWNRLNRNWREGFLKN